MAQLQCEGSFVCSPAVLFQKVEGVLDGKMNLVHALLISCGVCCLRDTQTALLPAGVFFPMRERLITGGEQRLPFMNLGPCSGEDRDKLGVLTPGAPEEENSNS